MLNFFTLCWFNGSLSARVLIPHYVFHVNVMSFIHGSSPLECLCHLTGRHVSHLSYFHTSSHLLSAFFMSLSSLFETLLQFRFNCTSTSFCTHWKQYQICMRFHNLYITCFWLSQDLKDFCNCHGSNIGGNQRGLSFLIKTLSLSDINDEV